MNISGKRKLSPHFYPYGILLLFSAGLLLWFLLPAEGETAVKAFGDYVTDLREAEQMLSGKEETERLLEDGEAGLHVNGYEAAFDKKKQIFYLYQPAGSEAWQGDLRPYGAELYILSDEYTEDPFRAVEKGHVFEAVFCTKDSYQRAGIVLTGMPVVKIETQREEPREYPVEDIDNYVFNSETRYYGEITVFQPGSLALPENKGAAEAYQVLHRKVCYHERGQNSALFSKKSYAVKLLNQKEKGISEPLLGMQRSTDWKLLAMYSDPNKVRDKVSMDLWEEIAKAEEGFNERGPEMEYCEVVLDGEYMGLYGMMLPVDEHTLGLGEGNVLYKILDWYMPEPADIQASIDQNYEVCYPVRIRYPEKNGAVEELWKPITEYFTCKYWSIDFNAYSEMSYVENLADYYIFIQTVSGFDNYLKNTYIFSEETAGGAGYKMITIPWDLNYTFGNCYSYEPDLNYTAFNDDASVNYVEPVLEQLFRSSFNGEGEVLKERWNKYRTGILRTEHITELLQENMDHLQETGAFARDTERWEGALNSSDLSEVESYVERRMLYLDEYFGNF